MTCQEPQVLIASRRCRRHVGVFPRIANPDPVTDAYLTNDACRHLPAFGVTSTACGSRRHELQPRRRSLSDTFASAAGTGERLGTAAAR